MGKLVWFALKFSALIIIGIFLYYRVYPFYLAYMVPYLTDLMSLNSSGRLQQSQVDGINTVLGIGVLLIGWVIALFKIVLGSHAKLSEDDLEIILCNSSKINDIPNLLCISAEDKITRQQISNIDTGMLDINKAEIRLALAGEGAEKISYYMVAGITLQMTQSQQCYKYKEVNIIKDSAGRKVKIERKVLPHIYIKNYESGRILINAFLLILRSKYAKRKKYIDTTCLFEPLEDEITVKLNIIWINRQGCPRYVPYKKRLVQKMDKQKNIYWKAAT